MPNLMHLTFRPLYMNLQLRSEPHPESGLWATVVDFAKDIDADRKSQKILIIILS